VDDQRRAEIAANLAAFQATVDAACAACGRDPAEVALIAVTKTFPASDVRALAELGVTDVGENRDQEAAPKHELCTGLPLRWHFVGGLQRNKARSVASYADVVHSVDRIRLVDALSHGANTVDRSLTVLVQVSLDAEAQAAGRHGAEVAEIAELAAAIVAAPALTLGGVMAVAPLGDDPDRAFGRLAQVSADLRSEYPSATMISAGMSGDFESAVRHGATHLRVGTALLGRRSGHFG
jgi:hypothetical protein